MIDRQDKPRVGQVKEVTSLSNPLVKDIRALALKKFRDQQGAFMAEGLKLVIDALDQGWTIRSLVFAKAGLGNASVERAAARTVAAGGTVLEVGEKVLGAITRRDNPQMVVGVFAQRLAPLPSIRPSGDDVWVALDRVRDPGNLGTIIRTADAVGCAGVVLVGTTCDPYSLEAIRATMGSIFAVPIAKLDRAAFLELQKAWRGDVIGTHLDARDDFRTSDYGGPQLIVMGSEGPGLSSGAAAVCTKLVKIPMAGKLDSLNLAIATALMLYQVRGPQLKL